MQHNREKSSVLSENTSTTERAPGLARAILVIVGVLLTLAGIGILVDPPDLWSDAFGAYGAVIGSVACAVYHWINRRRAKWWTWLLASYLGALFLPLTTAALGGHPALAAVFAEAVGYGVPMAIVFGRAPAALLDSSNEREIQR